MNTSKIPMYWEGEQHPTLELLRQYQEDALPAAASHQVERHLLTCDLCIDMIEGLVLSDKEQTSAAVSDIHHRLKTTLYQKNRKKHIPKLLWADWRMAAAILVLLCSTALVFFYQFSLLQQERAEAIQISPPDPDFEFTLTAPIDIYTPASRNTIPQNNIAQSPRTTANRKTKEMPVSTGDAHTSELQSSAIDRFALQKEGTIQPHSDLAGIEHTTIVSSPLNVPFDTITIPPRVISGVVEGNKLDNRPATFTHPPGSFRSGSTITEKPGPATGRQVSGKVLSADGQALPGVNVVIKGTAVGASTDAQGNFTIQVPENKETLQFNYIGFEQQEIKLTEETANVNVSLSEDTKSLSEVVVVGYGTKSEKTTVTSAPAPVAGMRAYKKYLQENLRYQNTENQRKVQGSVIVGFTITASGQLDNIHILKSLSPAHDREAIRLIKEGPAWKPGMPSPQEVKVAVKFRK